MTTNEHARKLGKLGGSRNTAAQNEARKANAVKARAARKLLRESEAAKSPLDSQSA